MRKNGKKINASPLTLKKIRGTVGFRTDINVYTFFLEKIQFISALR